MESVKTGTHWHWKCSAEGGLPKWHPHCFFSQRNFLQIPAPLAHMLKLVDTPYIWCRHFSQGCLSGGSWSEWDRMQTVSLWSLGFLLACSSPGVKPCWFFNAPGFTPCWFSKPDVIGTCLPRADPQGKGRSMPDMVLEAQHSLGLCICAIPPACGLLCQGLFPEQIVLLPLPSFLMSLFLCIFTCGRTVLLAFRLFSEEVVLH